MSLKVVKLSFFVTTRDSKAPLFLSTEPYALLGFKIDYRAKKGWSAFVEAKNLTDERYPASVDPIADASVDDDVRVFHPGDRRSVHRGVSWTR